MRIAMTGSSGFLGSALTPYLQRRDHEVTPLVRSKDRLVEGAVFWNPYSRECDRSGLDGHDAIVHLAGVSLASLWTDKRKKRIWQSRIDGTRYISQVVASLENPPRILISASAIGYYGDRGEELLNEQSRPGEGFLADLCRKWEDSTRAASEAGMRVVNMRFGLLLDKTGGALQKMLTPFRLGAGGRIGSGEQFMSWIALEDAMGAVHHALMNDDVEGPINVVSPHPVTNREFTRALGGVLGRPTVLPLPEFAARAALGEMGEQTLLASQRVEPRRLVETGYEFGYPEIEAALQHILQ